MKDYFEIEEIDLFKYVFEPELLAAEKRQYIGANRIRFKVQIEYCETIKKEGYKITADKIFKMIEHRLQHPNIIELLPSKDQTEIKTRKNSLAAAGDNHNTRKSIYNFNNITNDCIVKIISTGEKYLLYYFTKSPTSKVKITLYPSGATHIITQEELPIEIMEQAVIERIFIQNIS